VCRWRVQAGIEEEWSAGGECAHANVNLFDLSPSKLTLAGWRGEADLASFDAAVPYTSTSRPTPALSAARYTSSAAAASSAMCPIAL